MPKQSISLTVSIIIGATKLNNKYLNSMEFSSGGKKQQKTDPLESLSDFPYITSSRNSFSSKYSRGRKREKGARMLTSRQSNPSRRFPFFGRNVKKSPRKKEPFFIAGREWWQR